MPNTHQITVDLSEYVSNNTNTNNNNIDYDNDNEILSRLLTSFGSSLGYEAYKGITKISSSSADIIFNEAFKKAENEYIDNNDNFNSININNNWNSKNGNIISPSRNNINKTKEDNNSVIHNNNSNLINNSNNLINNSINNSSNLINNNSNLINNDNDLIKNKLKKEVIIVYHQCLADNNDDDDIDYNSLNLHGLSLGSEFENFMIRLYLIPKDNLSNPNIRIKTLIQQAYLFAIILPKYNDTNTNNTDYDDMISLIGSLTEEERLALIATNCNMKVTLEQCILLLEIVHGSELLLRNHQHDNNFIEELRINRLRNKQSLSLLHISASNSVNNNNNNSGNNNNKSFYEKFGKDYEFDRERYKISRWNKVPCSDDPMSKENDCTFKPAISKKGAAIHKKLPERFHSSVHDRLSSDRPLSLSTAAANPNPASMKPEVYRKKETRRLEEIERDEHCTFRPQIFENPFVSGRYLGQVAYDKNKDYMNNNNNDIDQYQIKDSRNKNTLGLGGQFFIGLGYVEGPPSEPGLDLFLFNIKYPPNFDEGTYVVLEAIETVVVTTNTLKIETNTSNNSQTHSDDIPPAPPLPKKVSIGQATTKVTIKTPSVKKGPPPPPSATGWQQVLEEMKAKRDSILKVTNTNPTKSPEKKAVGKLGISGKKARRKTGGFSDVIDELSYTLAKMRGEVGDGESDDEEEEQVEIKKINPKGTSVASKLFASTPLPPPPPPTASNNTNTSIGVIAVPIPAELPCPPPLPESSWPKPVPYIAEKKADATKPKMAIVSTSNSSSSPTSSSGTITEASSEKTVHSTKVVSRMLPSGYYMPTEVIGSIYPGSIVPSGKTTLALIGSLTQKFENSTRLSISMEIEEVNMRSFNDNVHVDNEGNAHVEGKMTISDLPLPCSFHKSVQRLQAAKDAREKARALEESVAWRNYENIESNTDRPRSTTPKPFHFRTVERSETKQHSFRSTALTLNPRKSKLIEAINHTTTTKLNKTITITNEDRVSKASQSIANSFSHSAKMKRSSFINAGNMIDFSMNSFNNSKHEVACNKLSLGLSAVSQDNHKKESLSSKRKLKEKEDEEIAKEEERKKKEMLYKKALETAKKNGVYSGNNSNSNNNNGGKSFMKALQKHSNSDLINVESLTTSQKQYFNIDHHQYYTPRPAFQPAYHTPVSPSITSIQEQKEREHRQKKELENFIKHSRNSFISQ